MLFKEPAVAVFVFPCSITYDLRTSSICDNEGEDVQCIEEGSSSYDERIILMWAR